MTEYQIIAIVLYILLVLILGYDKKRWIEGNNKYHLLRMFAAILLTIAAIYIATL